MRCKIFMGTAWIAAERFNEWAKGKALTKEIIIHTHIVYSNPEDPITSLIAIVVIHPEDPFWDEVKP